MSEARSTVRAGALRINVGKGWVHPLGIREAGGGRGGAKEKGRGWLSSCVWMTFPCVYLERLGSHTVFGVGLPCCLVLCGQKTFVFA